MSGAAQNNAILDHTAVIGSWSSGLVAASETALQETLNDPSAIGGNAVVSCTISRASSTTQSSTTLFTLFPKLPPEIRKMIWTFASCHPQIIKRLVNRYSRSRLPFRLVGNSVSLLSACRDSCRAALEVHPFISMNPISKPFYVSSRKTILLLDSIAWSSSLPSALYVDNWQQFVTVLAVDPFFRCPQDIIKTSSHSIALLEETKVFENLQEIILLSHSGFEQRALKLASQMRAV